MTGALSADTHDLGNGVALRPLADGEAATLAVAFAGIEPWCRYPFQAGQLQTSFESRDASSPCFAITVDEAAAGVVAIQWRWLRGPYLQFLGVLPARQHRGVGGRILRWLEADAVQAGARQVFVCVSDFNASARRFYERHGFEIVGPLPDLVKDGFTELLLRRRLQPNSPSANGIS